MLRETMTHHANTETPGQQALWAVYDAALRYAESRCMNNIKASDFLAASFQDRQIILDVWDSAGQPAPETEALLDFIRNYFN